MAKLVVLKKGSPGVSYDLKAERTTIGRNDDNSFQIAEASVSGHHCEILMQGNEFHIKDLGSTNGTYVEGHKYAEGPIKPGQLLRLGEVEIRFETEDSSKQNTTRIRTSSSGVNLLDLKTDQIDVQVDRKTFSKKSNKTDKLFVIGGSILALIIIGFLIYALFLSAGK